MAEASYFTMKDGRTGCDPSTDRDLCLLRIYDPLVTAKASLMFSTSLASITDFCDDTNERRHNRKAVTEQNIKCNYKSTWEVISSHNDFRNQRKQDGKRSPRPTTPVNTKPVIRIVQQKSSGDRYVLVLDVSGSMAGTPIQLLHEAASRFIADHAPENISIGIVTFSSDTSIKRQLTRVNSSTRKTLIDSLPNHAVGGTGIGNGLKTGLEVLQGGKNQSIEGSVILLITDGEETDKPFIEEVLPTIVQKKVIVKAIAYGDKATAKLANLTSTTGGLAYFFKNIQDQKASTEGLDSAFLEAVTLQSDVAFEPVSIASTSQAMYLEEQTFKVLLDEELGRNTIFSITSSDITVINMELRSPSHQLHTYQSAEYKKDEYLKRIIFRFAESEVGEWTVVVRRLSAADASAVKVTFSLTSEPKDAKNQPVRIKTSLSANGLRPPATLKIFAVVTKSNLPVIRAKVVATVVTPKQKIHKVRLRDNGKYPDGTKEDGVYTAFFTGYDSVGRYSVSAVITGRKKPMVKRLRRRKRDSGTNLHRNRRFANPPNSSTETTTDDYDDYEDEIDDYSDDSIYEVEPIGSFERTSNVGVFSVEGYNENAGDIIPPVRIVDLDVLSAEIAADGKRQATVAWTSPGDDENFGNATYLELRASTDFDLLLTNFSAAKEINSAFVVHGTLQPAPGSEMQNVTVTLPIYLFHINDVNGTLLNVSNILYLSLRAGDENNNVGEVSNIATAYFDDRVAKLSSSEKDETDEYALHPGIVILLVVFCGALVLVTLMLCLRQRRKRYNRVLVVHMKP